MGDPEVFRSLHSGRDPLVLVNAWDVASARVVEEAGLPAVATTSAGIAYSRGYPDGEVIDVSDMLDVVARIARAVDLPVTADMESGFGLPPVELAERLAAAGAVGLNFEDGTHDGTDPLVPAERHAERIAGIREAAGNGLFVNARVDVYIRGTGEPGGRFDETVRRATAYVAAGADGVFVPAVVDEDMIQRLAEAIPAPLNVLAVEGTPPVPRLAELGVRRVSLGSGPMRASLSGFQHVAEQVRQTGRYDAFSHAPLTHAAVNALLAARH